jgi:hypothetical protein
MLELYSVHSVAFGRFSSLWRSDQFLVTVTSSCMHTVTHSALLRRHYRTPQRRHMPSTQAPRRDDCALIAAWSSVTLVYLAWCEMEPVAVNSTPMARSLSSEVVDIEPAAVEDVEGSAVEGNTTARKIVRKQNLEKKAYSAHELAAVLRQRRIKAGHAKYWDQLAIDVVSVEERDGDEILCFDKVILRCMKCDTKHDTVSINVANFASTHFVKKDGELQCKQIKAQGTPAVVLCSLPYRNQCPGNCSGAEERQVSAQSIVQPCWRLQAV